MRSHWFGQPPFFNYYISVGQYGFGTICVVAVEDAMDWSINTRKFRFHVIIPYYIVQEAKCLLYSTKFELHDLEGFRYIHEDIRLARLQVHILK